MPFRASTVFKGRIGTGQNRSNGADKDGFKSVDTEQNEEDISLAERICRFVPRTVLERVEKGIPVKAGGEILKMEAAVGFFDISGFTKLSTKLSNDELETQETLQNLVKGRKSSLGIIGNRGEQDRNANNFATASLTARGLSAEVLTSNLNNMFGTVIQVIEDHGGDIIKFVGDAMIVLFASGNISGGSKRDDLNERGRPSIMHMHPTEKDLDRALVSAMRCADKALQVMKGLDTELGIHISIALGPVLHCITGHFNSRFEVFLAGEACSQMFKALDLAKVGEIVVPHSTWQRFDRILRQVGGSASAFPIRLQNPTTTAESHASGHDFVHEYARLDNMCIPPPPEIVTSYESAYVLKHRPLPPLPKPTAALAQALKPFLPYAFVSALDPCAGGARSEMRKLGILFISISGLIQSSDPAKTLQQRLVTKKAKELAAEIQFKAKVQKSMLALVDACTASSAVLRQFVFDDKGFVAVVCAGMPTKYSNSTNDPTLSVMAVVKYMRTHYRRIFDQSQFGLTTGMCFCGPVGKCQEVQHQARERRSTMSESFLARRFSVATKAGAAGDSGLRATFSSPASAKRILNSVRNSGGIAAHDANLTEVDDQGEGRQEYAIVGDPVNLAARLMSKASCGQVRVDQISRDAAIRDGYVFERLPDYTPKGKTIPIANYALDFNKSKGETNVDVANAAVVKTLQNIADDRRNSLTSINATNSPDKSDTQSCADVGNKSFLSTSPKSFISEAGIAFPKSTPATTPTTERTELFTPTMEFIADTIDNQKTDRLERPSSQDTISTTIANNSLLRKHSAQQIEVPFQHNDTMLPFGQNQFVDRGGALDALKLLCKPYSAPKDSGQFPSVRTLVVEGGAGHGKTALLQLGTNCLSAVHVLTLYASCHTGDHTRPFSSFRSIAVGAIKVILHASNGVTAQQSSHMLLTHSTSPSTSNSDDQDDPQHERTRNNYGNGSTFSRAITRSSSHGQRLAGHKHSQNIAEQALVRPEGKPPSYDLSFGEEFRHNDVAQKTESQIITPSMSRHLGQTGSSHSIEDDGSVSSSCTVGSLTQELSASKTSTVDIARLSKISAKQKAPTKAALQLRRLQELSVLNTTDLISLLEILETKIQDRRRASEFLGLHSVVLQNYNQDVEKEVSAEPKEWTSSKNSIESNSETDSKQEHQFPNKDEKKVRESICIAVSKLLRACADVGSSSSVVAGDGLAIIIDDAHNLDDASSQLLKYINDELPLVRIMISHRPLAIHRNGGFDSFLQHLINDRNNCDVQERRRHSDSFDSIEQSSLRGTITNVSRVVQTSSSDAMKKKRKKLSRVAPDSPVTKPSVHPSEASFRGSLSLETECSSSFTAPGNETAQSNAYQNLSAPNAASKHASNSSPWFNKRTEVVKLQPLSRLQLRKLILCGPYASTCIAEIQECIVNFVAQRSSGNPYVALEVINDLSEKKFVCLDEKTGVLKLEKDTRALEFEIPESVRHSVISAFDSIDSAKQGILRLASTLGSRVDVACLTYLFWHFFGRHMSGYNSTAASSSRKFTTLGSKSFASVVSSSLHSVSTGGITPTKERVTPRLTPSGAQKRPSSRMANSVLTFEITGHVDFKRELFELVKMKFLTFVPRDCARSNDTTLKNDATSTLNFDCSTAVVYNSCGMPLFEGTSLVFCRDLTRQVIYHQMLASDRKQVHTKILNWQCFKLGTKSANTTIDLSVFSSAFADATDVAEMLPPPSPLNILHKATEAKRMQQGYTTGKNTVAATVPAVKCNERSHEVMARHGEIAYHALCADQSVLAFHFCTRAFGYAIQSNLIDIALGYINDCALISENNSLPKEIGPIFQLALMRAIAHVQQGDYVAALASLNGALLDSKQHGRYNYTTTLSYFCSRTLSLQRMIWPRRDNRKVWSPTIPASSHHAYNLDDEGLAHLDVPRDDIAITTFKQFALRNFDNDTENGGLYYRVKNLRKQIKRASAAITREQRILTKRIEPCLMIDRQSLALPNTADCSLESTKSETVDEDGTYMQQELSHSKSEMSFRITPNKSGNELVIPTFA